MKSALLNFAWIWLLINAIITLSTTLTRRYRSQHNSNYKTSFQEDKTNLKLSIINGLRGIIEGLIGFSLLALILYHTPHFSDYKMNWSFSSLVLCFLCVDAMYFLNHFASHKIQILWNQHSVHHSSQAYTLSTGYRLSWIEFLFSWLFYLPLGFLGFPTEMILVSLILITNYTHILHTTYLKNLPFLEFIFNSPKAHRIHHSAYEEHIDKNMAGVFMFWDHLFGTFSLKADSKVVYGLTEPLTDTSLWQVNFCEWIRIKKVYQQCGFKKYLQMLFQSPEKNKYLLNVSSEKQ